MSDHRELPPPTAPKPKPEPEHFRRRQFVAPHRRRKLIFRLAGPFLAAVAVVGLPSAVVGWVALSDQFTVRSVTVASGDRVSMSWAAERLRVLEGRHLMAVDVREVEAILTGHPWVEGVLIDRRPPDRLRVDIVEKRPAALLARSDELVFVDAAGEPIGAYEPAADPGDLVVLSTPADRPDLVASGLALVDDWRRRRLPWAEGLSEVNVLAPTDFRVITAALRCPLLVSSTHLAEGLAALVRYGPQIERQISGLPRSGQSI